MRLLDRYQLRELLMPLGFCLGGFLVVWSFIELISELPDLQKAKLHGLDVPEYCLMQAPDKLLIIVPVALLLSLLYALTQHARNNEITAMRAAGISLWRLGAPYLAVGFVMSLVVLALGEMVVPQANAHLEEIMTRRMRAPGAQTGHKEVQSLAFENTSLHHGWFARSFVFDTAEMRGLILDRRLPDGTHSQIRAARGVYTNGAWALFDVQEFRATSPSDATLVPRPHANYLFAADFTETPEQIRSEVKISAGLNERKAKRADIPVVDLLDYLRLHPQPAPGVRNWISTKLHGRLASPWTCLMVVLIALPIGTGSSRGNVFAGVAGSIFIYFTFHVLSLVSLTLGTRGLLPPMLAAWLPNIVFGGLAVALILKKR